jgi:excisionase family DNA binding protein
MQQDRLLTVREIAAVLTVKERTIYAWVQERRIPFRKAGRLLRFERAEVLAWAQAQAQAQATDTSTKALRRVV